MWYMAAHFIQPAAMAKNKTRIAAGFFENVNHRSGLFPAVSRPHPQAVFLSRD